MISSNLTIWEKIRTRCPSALSLLRSLSSNTILPDVITSPLRISWIGLDRSSAPSNRYGWLLTISSLSILKIDASLRGLLEFHGNVHQADLLGSAFTQSRKVLNVSPFLNSPLPYLCQNVCKVNSHSSKRWIDSLL